MTNPYEDILYLPHHRSNHRPHMNIHDRAAQFSPFAALTGFDSALEETRRLTDPRMEHEEYGQAVLDRKLTLLLNTQETSPKVTITYFCPDKRKAGGSYEEIAGQIRKIDLYRKYITLEDGAEIFLDDIADIVFEE